MPLRLWLLLETTVRTPAGGAKRFAFEGLFLPGCFVFSEEDIVRGRQESGVNPEP